MSDGHEFGVPQLDRMLEGIPSGATILFLSDPGVEAEPFLYQSADRHLKAGREVVYVVTNRGPKSVLESMDSFGFSTNTENLHFVDAFSALMGADEDAAYRVQDPTDLEQLAAILQKVRGEHEDAVVIVDALSTVVDHASPEAFADQFPAIMDALEGFAMSSVLFTKWPYGGDLDRLFDRFQALVRLKGVEERVMFSQFFAVERANWVGEVNFKPQLYKTMKPGGVFVYIPKIVVTGPFEAGKSTFVHSVSDEAVSVDRMGTTVALDHGHVTIDGLIADVFGTPGQSRFDPILKTIAGQALGVIVMVDATRPDTFPRAKDMMQQTWRQGLPIVIAANKQDVDGAMTPDDVERHLKPPQSVSVVGCQGQERDSARQVLEGLIDKILRGSANA